MTTKTCNDIHSPTTRMTHGERVAYYTLLAKHHGIHSVIDYLVTVIDEQRKRNKMGKE